MKAVLRVSTSHGVPVLLSNDGLQSRTSDPPAANLEPYYYTEYQALSWRGLNIIRRHVSIPSTVSKRVIEPIPAFQREVADSVQPVQHGGCTVNVYTWMSGGHYALSKDTGPSITSSGKIYVGGNLHAILLPHWKRRSTLGANC